MTIVYSTTNLFDYATSELSQDAFLCWLLAWSDQRHANTNAALHETAVQFVQSLFGKHKKEISQSFSIEIYKQYKSIDILALLEQSDKKYALLIEDKTDTTIHGDQLERYKDSVESDYPDHTPLPIYLKTGAISMAATAEDAGYKVYSGPDLETVLENGKDKINSDIFVSFYEHLKQKNACYAAFRTKKVDEWVEEWDAWKGFYMYLQSEIKDLEWGYAANQAGGELVAYWGYRPKECGDVYLEIHKKSEGRYFLAFKVNDIPDYENNSEVRNMLHECLMNTAEGKGWSGKIKKPQRFGNGKSMVFCETDENNSWLAKDDDGKLDKAATLENLEHAKKILAAAVEYLADRK